MHLKGKKRHEIAYDLNTSGIKISTGSISNVISEWRQRERMSNVREQPDLNKSDRVTTFTKEVLGEAEFKNNPDISIGNHVINNTQDFEENGYPIEGSQGQKGPLSWFTNGYDSEIKSEDSSHIDEEHRTSVASFTPILKDVHKHGIVSKENSIVEKEPDKLALGPNYSRKFPKADAVSTNLDACRPMGITEHQQLVSQRRKTVADEQSNRHSSRRRRS